MKRTMWVAHETRKRAGAFALAGIGILLISAPGCIGSIFSGPGPVPATTSPAASASPAPAPDNPGDTSPVGVLSVNEETIEAGALWRNRRDKLETRVQVLSPPAYRAFVQETAARLITDKIAEMLLYQRASLQLSPETNGKVDAYVDGEVRKIVASQYGGTERRYEKYLESRSHTLAEVRDELRRSIIISSFLDQEVRPKVPEPTRAELLALFHASADSLSRPPRRRMSLIDVRVTDRLASGLTDPTREQSAAARDAAQTRIQSAQTELTSAEAFADVAGRYSDGLHAVEGGAWGWVTKGSVRERFEPAVEALFRLDARKVSDIIETDDAFFIVRCDEIDPGYESDFQTAQPRLTEFLLREAHSRRIAELVAELRADARIEPANLERFHAALVQSVPVVPPSPTP